MKTRCLPSYVYKHWNNYYVQQWQGGKLKTFGKFKTEHEAIQCRNKLIQDGTLKERGGKHRIKDWNMRYIHQNHNGKYSIHKQVNGEFTHFGTFKTIEDAIDERDYLESIGWDYDNME